MLTQWPTADDGKISADTEAQMAMVMDVSAATAIAQRNERAAGQKS